MELERKYGSVVRRHFKIISSVEEEYSIWYNMGMPDDARKQKIISLCEEDIALSPIVKSYFLESNPGEPLPSYESYKRLAILYEKTKDYERAHDVCLRALESGFVSEGGGRTVHSRLARLERKR